jgi:hypothetical protein
MSYKLDSDFPWTYFGNVDKYLDLFRADSVIPFREKNQQVLVAWLASNCNANNKRHMFVRDLMKYIRIDSLGGCMNNQKHTVKNVSTVDTIRPYMFYLALENSECRDYISEKLGNAMKAGAIPIVSDSVTGYNRFLPLNNRIIINVQDFASTRDLALYIMKVSQNESLYREYHTFRKKSVAQDFLRQANGFEKVNT